MLVILLAALVGFVVGELPVIGQLKPAVIYMQAAKVTFFPVDNGDMILIRLADSDSTTLLVDCKIREMADDLDDKTPDVASALRDRLKYDVNSRPYVDAMLLSHPEEDHCLGLRKHFWFGPLSDYPDDKKPANERRIVIRQIWLSPMVFRRTSKNHVLCEDAKAFSKEAKRRAQANKDNNFIVGDGDKILVLGEDENGKTDELTQIPVKRGSKFSGINGKASGYITATLMAPFGKQLAVFLRTLVHSTGGELTRVDFPGNDDAGRPGWDGVVEASEGTPWVPAGRSGWEFGTNEDPKKKTDGDFEKSVKGLDKEERAKTVFVFVTPRRWTGKTAWVTANKAKGLWKDVRAYDASDLEQWLEQSLPAQAWFANEAHIPAQHIRSLDRCWTDWANVTTPPLFGTLLDSAIEAAKRTILSRLSKPAERPILIAADSTEEALAFLAQALGESGGEDLTACRGRVLVFDELGVLPRLAGGVQTFIPVVFTREAERELAPFVESMHSFAVYPRNAVTITPDIVLEPVNYEVFNKALEEMGKNRDEVSRLANASGRSLTVLRCQLSAVPAVWTPE